MLFTKMNEIIDEVSAEVAEREELIECIALALLSKKNLFILGDTGQAKSYAINEFRKRITGAKQFERLMSKQTDEEQIFGRLDLSSLIPGNMPHEELIKEQPYADFSEELAMLYDKYKTDKQMSTLKEAAEAAKKMEYIKSIICALKNSTPKIITDGKIPDSHIVFLDEIFKSNDGILNSLLTALNERVYTNEGQIVNIPVISFFAASNEIPDFNDSAQTILKPLYDRFELKVLTRYVEEKANRLAVLKAKQSTLPIVFNATITLSELEQMQKDAEKINVPDSINELMDNVLCALRQNGIHVSDRKFFGFTPIVRAKAYLSGNTEVTSKDLLVLKNYFWNSPEEISKVERILTDICENPIGAEVEKLLTMSRECMAELDTVEKDSPDYMKLYVKCNAELFKIYTELEDLKTADLSDADNEVIRKAETEFELMNKEAAEKAAITHIPLEDKMKLNV